MTEYRNLTVRLLQVVWVLGVIFFILICLFMAFMTIGGDGEEALLLSLIVGGASLAFILLMMSLQYIFFSTYNVNNLFDGSLLQ